MQGFGKVELPEGFSLRIGPDGFDNMQLVTPAGTYSFQMIVYPGGEAACHEVEPCSVTAVVGGKLQQGVQSSQGGDASWGYVFQPDDGSLRGFRLDYTRAAEPGRLPSPTATAKPRDSFTQDQALALLKTPDVDEIINQLNTIVIRSRALARSKRAPA